MDQIFVNESAKKRRISQSGSSVSVPSSTVDVDTCGTAVPDRPFDMSDSPFITLNSPLRLTNVYDLPESQNVQSIKLNDILGHPLIRECWQFNFIFDVEFLRAAFDPDIRDVVKIKIIHGFWRQNDPMRALLDKSVAKYPNISLIAAYLPEMFGTHHSKMMIIFRADDLAQVVIHTANMIQHDWRNLTQGVWLSPLLPLLSRRDKFPRSCETSSPDRDVNPQTCTPLPLNAQSTVNQKTSSKFPPSQCYPIGTGERFKHDLLRYLNAYSGRLRALVNQLSPYDFSSVQAAFISSVPARLPLRSCQPNLQTSWGWVGLHEILSTISCRDHLADPSEGPPDIAVQVSSVATFTERWFCNFKYCLATSSQTGGPLNYKASHPVKSSLRHTGNDEDAKTVPLWNLRNPAGQSGQFPPASTSSPDCPPVDSSPLSPESTLVNPNKSNTSRNGKTSPHQNSITASLSVSASATRENERNNPVTHRDKLDSDTGVNEDGDSSPTFRLIYPTTNEIRFSLEGYSSGSSIIMKTQGAARQKQLKFLKPYLCHWAGSAIDNNSLHQPEPFEMIKETANWVRHNGCESTDVNESGNPGYRWKSGGSGDAMRSLAAPHIKTYVRFSSAKRQTIDWAMVTSANLSTQAWGSLATWGKVNGNTSGSKNVAVDTTVSTASSENLASTSMQLSTSPISFNGNKWTAGSGEKIEENTAPEDDLIVRICSYETGVIVWPALFADTKNLDTEGSPNDEAKITEDGKTIEVSDSVHGTKFSGVLMIPTFGSDVPRFNFDTCQRKSARESCSIASILSTDSVRSITGEKDVRIGNQTNRVKDSETDGTKNPSSVNENDEACPKEEVFTSPANPCAEEVTKPSTDGDAKAVRTEANCGIRLTIRGSESAVDEHSTGTIATNEIIAKDLACENGWPTNRTDNRPKMNTLVGLRMPYNLPIRPYSDGQQPWNPYESHKLEDRFGRTYFC